MKKENDEITELFRTRLDNAEINPRDGFWEEVKRDIPLALNKHRRFFLYRTAAAASVFIVLGAASAAFLYFSPKEEIKQAFTKAVIKSNVNKTIVSNQIELKNQPIAEATSYSVLKSSKKKLMAVASKATKNHSNPNIKDTSNDNDSVTVTVHMSFRVVGNSGNQNQSTNNNGVWQAGNTSNVQYAENNSSDKPLSNNIETSKKDKTWAIKAALSASIPARGTYSSPLEASVTIEKQINKVLSLESGIQYSYLHSEGQTLNYIGIPVKMNVNLAKLQKVDLYASIGGITDKYISGSSKKNFSDESIQLTAIAGLGIRYHLNNKISLYAEPTFTHYFNNNSEFTSYRTERSNNLKLLCGLRMVY